MRRREHFALKYTRCIEPTHIEYLPPIASKEHILALDGIVVSKSPHQR